MTRPSDVTGGKRAAIYTRKSTTMGLEQEFNSLDAQREACAAYVERQRWTLVQERYDDGGFTGANTDRPAFQRLMADVDAGKIEVVVCYKVDRLSRSLLDFAKVMEQLNQSGASFVSVTQNFSTADAMGRMTLGLLMTFAQFEREMTAERTRDKVLAARRKGKWTGGHTPLGYSVHSGKLVIDEREAVIVREAFDLLLQLRSPTLVARALNERGWFPKGLRKPPVRQQPRWTCNSLSKLLRSPVYAGRVRAGADVVSGEHQPLVPHETFDRAQSLLGNATSERHLLGINDAYLLRGLLRCGLCGGPMTPASTRKREREYRYYVCSSRNRGRKEACTARPLPAGAIEQFVVERLHDALPDFSKLWDLLSTRNRARHLHSLVERVIVDEATGRAEVHLANPTSTEVA